jgi:NCS1 family nucleobase:cation symporter-1
VIQGNGNIELKNWELVSVNPSDKKWDWKDLFCFWGNNIQSIIGFSLIASLYLLYSLNFLVVLFGCLIGSFFVYLFANLIGKPSQRHGIPFPVFLRISMGINGARYISLFRGLIGIFMFGVQTYFLSKSFSYLIRIGFHLFDNTILDQDIFLIFYLGMNFIDWAAFIFAILLQFFLFSRGHSFNKLFINFSAMFVYFGLSLFLIIIISENYIAVSQSFKDLLIFENFLSRENIIPIITIAGTIFAYFSIVILNFGDFSRYVKNEKELNFGNLSLILNLIIFSLFSVLIVIGADIIFNKNLQNIDQILTNPTDIIGKFDNISLSIIVLFFILFSSASTNLIANYVPSQNTLLNFFPQSLNLKSAGVIVAIFGFFIGIFWIPVLSQIGILSFVDTIGAFFGPIFGIVIVDYYLIKKGKLNNKDIFSSIPNSSYYYSSGWHIKAIYSLFIGFIFSASTIWNLDLRFLQSFSWLIGGLMSSITYYLLANR